MFVPFTPGSELARLLRENEEKLVKLTGCKVKIVERTGIKIQELLTKSNPWKGHDCERQNCLLCFTKLRTEKRTTQDCHQRNVVYQTTCLDCQEREHDKIEIMDISEHEKRELRKNIKLSLYIGETSRSTYERGWEHLNDLSTLSNKSHMLKHILTEHPGQEIKKVKFGMSIIKTCRTSFERQIYESVAIQQAREQHNILNSRAEYNRCSLPRLSTQLGDTQNEKYNKELELEKKAEDELEKKIRHLRKQRNKERLVPVRECNVGTKRRKLNSQTYITIEENWGPPTTPAPEKTKREQEDTPIEHPSKRTRTKSNTQPTILTNLRTIENKVITIEENNKNLEWEEPRDWNQVLREHRERIEREELELNERLEKQRKKKESWALYTLCKNYLEENNNFWKRLKEKQNEENKRIERIEKARIKAREARNKYENKEWEQRLQEGLEKVPRQERDRVEEMNARQENLELKTAKEKLWKLRNKENKLVETAEVRQIRELDKKTEQVIELLEKEKTRLLARDKNLRTAIKNPENKIKKQKLIAEVWTTYRWITEYLEQTTSDWDKKKKQRVLEETTRLNNWDNKTRNEKIKSWIEDEKQRREQETTNKQEFITTIIQEILFKVETSVAKLQIMNVTTANNVKSRNLLQPPKLLQQTNNEQVQTVTKEKKQLNIKNFFQQKEITDRTSSTQITTCSTFPAEGGVTVPSLPTVEASTDKWAGGERGSQKERDPGGGYVPTSFLLTHKIPPGTKPKVRTNRQNNKKEKIMDKNQTTLTKFLKHQEMNKTKNNSLNNEQKMSNKEQKPQITQPQITAKPKPAIKIKGVVVEDLTLFLERKKLERAEKQANMHRASVQSIDIHKMSAKIPACDGAPRTETGQDQNTEVVTKQGGKYCSK